MPSPQKIVPSPRKFTEDPLCDVQEPSERSPAILAVPRLNLLCSVLTYEDARPWARAIKEKVVKREMPPWYIDKNIGIAEFKDDPSLSHAEIATIAKWGRHRSAHRQHSRYASGVRGSTATTHAINTSWNWHGGSPH